MKIREKIYKSIKEMDAQGLSLLYDQIKSMEKRKSKLIKKKNILPIEKIQELTASENNWSDTVVQDREERI